MMTFEYLKKADCIVALCEMQRSLGDAVEVGLPLDDYKKAIAKYENRRGS
jgi:hypothetical protein